MKKRIYLLVTVLLSLFIFAGRVEAANELVCIYEGGAASNGKMLVQDSKGNITILTTQSAKSYLDFPNWVVLNKIVPVFESQYYDKETKLLSQCPSYSEAFPLSSKGDLNFYDEKKGWKLNYGLIDNGTYDYIPDVLNKFNEIKKDTDALAKEMMCIYPGNGITIHKMLVQDKFGNVSLYVADSGEANIDNKNWRITDSYYLKFSKTKFYDADNTGYLTGCPEYSSKVKVSGSGNIEFCDTEKSCGKYKLAPDGEFDYISDNLNTNLYFDFSSTTDYSDEINNNDWIGRCNYGSSDDNSLSIYFNESKIIVDNNLTNRSNSSLKFTLDEFLSFVYTSKKCPNAIYENYVTSTNSLTSGLPIYGDYYLKKPTGLGAEGVIGETQFVTNRLALLDSSEIYQELGVNIDEEIDDCGDLLGEEVLGIINKIMNWIKIIIPILLIAYGTLDFTKAIFSGKEDDMAKLRKTFINRIIAAILVFIAPIFVNLLLTLANEVWDFINPNTCLEVSEE